MNKIKIGLRGLNAKSLLQKVDNISAAKAWGVLFSNETKTFKEMLVKRNELDSAIKIAAYGDKRAIEIRRNCESKLKDSIRNLAAFVNHKSGGENRIILDSGFELKQTNNKAKPLENPLQPLLKRTEISGELKVTWKPVANSRNYIIQSNIKNPKLDKHWTTFCFSTKSRCTLFDLQPGKTYWIRVRAIGSEGIGPPSDVVRIMAA